LEGANFLGALGVSVKITFGLRPFLPMSSNQVRAVSIKVRPTCQIVHLSARSFVAL